MSAKKTNISTDTTKKEEDFSGSHSLSEFIGGCGKQVLPILANICFVCPQSVGEYTVFYIADTITGCRALINDPKKVLKNKLQESQVIKIYDAKLEEYEDGEVVLNSTDSQESNSQSIPQYTKVHKKQIRIDNKVGVLGQGKWLYSTSTCLLTLPLKSRINIVAKVNSDVEAKNTTSKSTGAALRTHTVQLLGPDKRLIRFTLWDGMKDKVQDVKFSDTNPQYIVLHNASIHAFQGPYITMNNTPGDPITQITIYTKGHKDYTVVANQWKALQKVILSSKIQLNGGIATGSTGEKEELYASGTDGQEDEDEDEEKEALNSPDSPVSPIHVKKELLDDSFTSGMSASAETLHSSEISVINQNFSTLMSTVTDLAGFVQSMHISTEDQLRKIFLSQEDSGSSLASITVSTKILEENAAAILKMLSNHDVMLRALKAPAAKSDVPPPIRLLPLLDESPKTSTTPIAKILSIKKEESKTPMQTIAPTKPPTDKAEKTPDKATAEEKKSVDSPKEEDEPRSTRRGCQKKIEEKKKGEKKDKEREESPEVTTKKRKAGK